MAQAQGNHAWLFQYRPEEDSAWLEKLQNEKRISWRIVRWARETKVEDLVFFWESGKNGGLRGWGLVSAEIYEGKTAGNRTVWRVPVEVAHWLDAPIRRSSILSAGVFNQDNLYLSMPQGANFRLEPEEAERMLKLIPDTPIPFSQFQALVSHPARQEGDERLDDLRFGKEGEDESTLTESSEDAVESREPEYDLLEVAADNDITPLARELLNQASFYQERLSGPISSTRLFLAICELAEPGGENALAVGDEGAALSVMHAVVDRHKSALDRMRSAYLSEQFRGRVNNRIRITQTIRNLLEHAQASELRKTKSGKVGVDDLFIAMFTVDAGRLPQRLEAVELSLNQLKQEIAYERHEGSAVLASKLSGLHGGGRGSGPRVLGPARLQVPVVRNDNPWQEGQKDMLGAEREAQAFAALALSPGFTPPLAVGVFGEWGSGKSFFMRLAHDNIKRLSNQAREQGATASLLGRVVQIRFNAWHYVDTNLWASLVDHIFTELDKATSDKRRSKSEQLFDQLATARELTLESAKALVKRREEQERAALAVADSERRLVDAQLRANSSPKIYWDAVREDFLEQTKLAEGELTQAADRLGLSKLETDIRPLAQALEELEDSRRKATVVAEGLKRQLGSWKMMGLFAAACLVAPAIAWVVRDQMASYFSGYDVYGKISEWSVATFGVLAAATGVIAKATRRVTSAIKVVQNFRDKLDASKAKVLIHPSTKVMALEKELALLNAEVAEGKSRLAASTERLSRAAFEYNNETGKARLLSFVRARVADKSYAKHLGLVATVRRDFEELSELISAAIDPGLSAINSSAAASEDLREFTQQVQSLIDYAKTDGMNLLHEEEVKKLLASANVKPIDQSESIDRIVLYIDDLDRCQPEKVAEVLQAVHLLLSFKLFIVFVAVDVRWVGKALQKYYPMLAAKSASDGSATAHDYLEKIFQVPYWVRPMSDGAGADFIRDRLTQPHQRLGSKSELPETVEKLPTADVSLVHPRVGAEPSKVENSGPEAESGVLVPDLDPLAPVPDLEELSSQLELSDDERELMVRLARCAGDSPRRLLRFLNVYQVAKASLQAEHHQEELDLLMTQIAIGTGAPDLAQKWNALLSNMPRFTAADDILKRVKEAFDKAETDQLQRLLDSMSILKAKQPDVIAADLLRYSELASRYSFTGASLTTSL